MSYNPHALDHFIMPRPSSNSPYLQSASLTNSIYNRVYRSLKSQKTIFITLLERTTNLEKQYQMEFNSLGTENKNHNSNFVNQPQNNIDENEKSPKKLDNHKSTTISKKLNNTQTHSKPENLNNLNIGKNCFSKSDGEALIVYKNIINKILNAFYGNLFQINFANSDQLQEILQNDLSPSTEKLGYKILAACLSIKRLISLLSFTNYAAQTEDIGNEFQFDHFNSYNKEEYPLSPLTNPSPSFEGFPTQVSQATHENNQKVNANNELNKNASTNNEILKNSSWLKTDDDLDNPLSGINKALNTSANVCNCNEMNSSNEFKCNNEEASQFPSVICRICEKEVPLCKIEAHSKSCVIAYESSKSMKSTDDHMRKLQAYAQQTVLHADWPGEEMNAKSVIIPILHVVALLDRAIAVDPHSCGASSELDLICGLLGSVGCIFGNPDASSIVSRAQALSAEKSTASVKLEEAMDIVKLTTNDENTDFKVTTIADFTFIRRISSGAYAKVYLTRRFQTGDLSATKVISRESLQQKNDFQRVMVEKNILAKITNPFMIRFFYSFTGKNNLYLVMEYCPGGDLFSVLQNIGRLPEDKAWVYTAEVVEALEFLRSRNVIHRDLKPDNILVNADGHLKLADFGMSAFGIFDRAVTSSNSRTSEYSFSSDSSPRRPAPTQVNYEQPNLNALHNQNETIDSTDYGKGKSGSNMSGSGGKSTGIAGTPDYIAPEVILQQPHTFTADYWSLGCIIYELLTGVPPFHCETPEDTFAMVLKGVYDESELEGHSPEVRDLIRRLLCRDPKKRLGSQSIDEIKNHPWFKGIDWNNLLEMKPPFVPQLENEEDTSYFEERYELTNDDESEIREDIKSIKDELEQMNREKKEIRKSSSFFNDEIAVSNTSFSDDELSCFPSLSSESLHSLTLEDSKKKIRKYRAQSFTLEMSPDSIQNFSGPLENSCLVESKSFSNLVLNEPQIRQKEKPKNKLSKHASRTNSQVIGKLTSDELSTPKRGSKANLSDET